MYDIEPFQRWREQYTPEEDTRSPFYGATYESAKQIYNYVIHPYWDEFGSETLLIKVLFVDYDAHFAIIECIGEWNDAIENDIAELKRQVIEPMLDTGIAKFVLLLDNVLNFHASDDCYYEEWAEEARDNDGWIAFVNTFDHVWQEMDVVRLQNYAYYGRDFNDLNWRAHKPKALMEKIEELANNGTKGIGW